MSIKLETFHSECKIAKIKPFLKKAINTINAINAINTKVDRKMNS